MKPKQLIWHNGHAETPFGAYSVIGHGRKWWLYLADRMTTMVRRKTKREAQAAAQADFERRYSECQDAEIRAAVLDMLRIAGSDDATIDERKRAVNTILEVMGEP